MPGLRQTIVALCALAATAPPAHAVQFVADEVVRLDGRIYRSAVYYKDGLCRVEHQYLGPIAVSIVRKDKGVIWSLMPHVHRFVTRPYTAPLPDLDIALDGETKRERIGTEQYEGHPTTVYLVTAESGDRVEEYYQWVADDLQLPVRVVRTTGDWRLEYRNIRTSPVSDRLFDLPRRYAPAEAVPAQPGTSDQHAD